MELILSGRRIDAAHAHRIGLVNRIVPAADLVAETVEFAALVASRAPLAQRFAKDVMMRAFDLPLADALRLESRSFHDLAGTRDLKEGTDAFREKRPADFKGRRRACGGGRGPGRRYRADQERRPPVPRKLTVSHLIPPNPDDVGLVGLRKQLIYCATTTRRGLTQPPRPKNERRFPMTDHRRESRSPLTPMRR